MLTRRLIGLSVALASCGYASRGVMQSSLGPSLALDGRGETFYLQSDTRIAVLERDGLERLRHVDTLAPPCSARGDLMDLEHFAGRLFALCRGGAVRVAEDSGWREVVPLVDADRTLDGPPVPTALQVSHGRLYRMYDNGGGAEQVDGPPDPATPHVVHPWIDGPDVGLGPSAVAPFSDAPGAAPALWLTVPSAHAPPAWWLRRPWLGPAPLDYELLLLHPRQNVRCRLRDSQVHDVAAASGPDRGLFAGIIRHRLRSALFVLDVAAPARRTAQKWRVFDLTTLRPVRPGRRITCR